MADSERDLKGTRRTISGWKQRSISRDMMGSSSRALSAGGLKLASLVRRATHQMQVEEKHQLEEELRLLYVENETLEGELSLAAELGSDLLAKLEAAELDADDAVQDAVEVAAKLQAALAQRDDVQSALEVSAKSERFLRGTLRKAEEENSELLDGLRRAEADIRKATQERDALTALRGAAERERRATLALEAAKEDAEEARAASQTATRAVVVMHQEVDSTKAALAAAEANATYVEEELGVRLELLCFAHVLQLTLWLPPSPVSIFSARPTSKHAPRSWRCG